MLKNGKIGGKILPLKSTVTLRKALKRNHRRGEEEKELLNIRLRKPYKKEAYMKSQKLKKQTVISFFLFSRDLLKNIG